MAVAGPSWFDPRVRAEGITDDPEQPQVSRLSGRVPPPPRVLTAPHPESTACFRPPLGSVWGPQGHGDRAYALTTLESALRYIEREGTRRLRAQRCRLTASPGCWPLWFV